MPAPSCAAPVSTSQSPMIASLRVLLSYLTELARTGLTVPASPLPASRPDAGAEHLPFRYFHVISEDPVAIGSAPGAAGGDTLFPGLRLHRIR